MGKWLLVHQLQDRYKYDGHTKLRYRTEDYFHSCFQSQRTIYQNLANNLCWIDMDDSLVRKFDGRQDSILRIENSCTLHVRRK